MSVVNKFNVNNTPVTLDKDFINVNLENNHETAYSSSTDARNAVPASRRKAGLQITYLLTDGWFVDQYVGSDVSGWEIASNWNVIDNANRFKSPFVISNGSSISLKFSNMSGIDPIKTCTLTVNLPILLSNYSRKFKIINDEMVFENAPYSYGGLYAILDKTNKSIERIEVGALAANVTENLPLITCNTSTEFIVTLATWRENIITYSISSQVEFNTKIKKINTKIDEIDTKIDEIDSSVDKRFVGLNVNDNATLVVNEKFTKTLVSRAKVGEKYKIKISTDNNLSVTLLAISLNKSYQEDRYFWMPIKPNNTYEATFEILKKGDIIMWTDMNNIKVGGSLNYELSLLGLEDRVQKLETPQFDTLKANIIPPAIYTVCNDITAGDNYIASRNYSLKLYIDHFFRFWEERKNIRVKNAENFFPFYSKLNGYGNYINSSTGNQTKDLNEIQNNINIVGDKIEPFTIQVTHRSTRNKAVENGKVRLLCIGDSVTEGVHAAYNAPYNNSPKRYWEWVTALFAMDKKENGDTGFDFLALGNLLGTSKSKTTFNIDFDNIRINDVTACACGVGGSKTQDWLNPNLNNGQINPFYDTVNQKFSLKYWVDKYRTLIVNPDGTTTRCDDGNKGELAPTDTSTNNVCEPTHVLIQLGYNQSYSSDGPTRQTYLSQLQEMIDTIMEEYPDVYILLSLPDTAGTYFPEYFPEYIGDNNDIYSLDFMRGSAKTSHNNFSFMNSDLIDLSNENEKIYYCPTFFASPLCIGASHRVVNEFAYNSSKNEKQKYNIHCGSLPNLHPNNAAHANWAYQIYSLIKYTLLIK